MKEMFEQIVMRLALCGLGASLALLALRSWPVRFAIARLAAIWRGLTAFGRFAVCAFLLVGVLEADKTNNVPPNMNSPLPQMQQGGVFLKTPPQQTFAERWAQNWNVCGAWRDSFWLPFEDGWVFPHGTNHLSGVEVVSYGQVWPAPYDKNAVAAIGVPVELVPGLSSFGYELTPSNSYRFVWTDAAINRDTNNIVSASIELFRNGDVSVATNDVAALLPRELPYPHNGFGQDDEWVSANFTNAAEILSVGYSTWVDVQVGTGLTNGLYKLTVTLADDPPETTFLSVGDLTIAATNAGEYVFLLDKGTRYDLSASADCAAGFLYSAVDDVSEPVRLCILQRNLLEGDGEDGTWSSDSAELRLFAPFGFVEWHPTLSISPRRWHPSRANAVRSFTATLTDVPFSASPSYAWSSADAEVCSCEGSSERTATFACHFPAAYGSSVSLGLDVTLNRTALHADYSRYIGYFSETEDYEDPIDDGSGEDDGDGPSQNLVVSASPSVVFFENGSTNVPCAEVGCFYLATEPGTFSLTLSGDAASVTDMRGAAVSSGYTWDTDGGVVGARHFLVESTVKSSSPSGTVFTVAFTPDEGTNTMTDASSVTFVEWKTETKETCPSNRRRKLLGVGEEVTISFSPQMFFPSATTAITTGSLMQSGAKYKYRAPTNSCDDVAIFRCLSGDICQITFSILEPTGNIVVNVASNVENHFNIAGTFEVYFDLVLAPTNVSFNGRVEVAEMGMVSTNATGYFANPSMSGFLDHGLHGAANWVEIEANNFAGMDTVGPGALYQPFSDGSFTWPIPNHWRMKGDSGNGKKFCNEDQRFAITVDGTTSVWKFGKRGERILNSDTVTITDEAMR